MCYLHSNQLSFFIIMNNFTIIGFSTIIHLLIQFFLVFSIFNRDLAVTINIFVAFSYFQLSLVTVLLNFVSVY